MKIKNPNFKTAAQLFVDEHRAAVDAFVAALPAGQEYIDFDELRANFAPLMGVEAETIGDGNIHEVLVVLGYAVVNS